MVLKVQWVGYAAFYWNYCVDFSEREGVAGSAG
jgi:hypothetical protein